MQRVEPTYAVYTSPRNNQKRMACNILVYTTLAAVILGMVYKHENNARLCSDDMVVWLMGWGFYFVAALAIQAVGLLMLTACSNAPIMTRTTLLIDVLVGVFGIGWLIYGNFIFYN